MRILLVEDDKELCDAIKLQLERAGYETDCCGQGQEAFYYASEYPYDVIILDRMLPQMDGLGVLGGLRRMNITTPVIITTALDGINDRIDGLDAGADDYLVKPYAVEELLARIRTSLRHSNRMASNSPLYIRPYKCQGLILDFEKRMLTLDGEEIHLTPVEYKIVAYLARNSGKVMTYASVMANVWGPFTDNNNRILRVNMANIRRKIERNPSQPQFLFTEVGVGYRMCEDENEV